jgi:hypothetical protein
MNKVFPRKESEIFNPLPLFVKWSVFAFQCGVAMNMTAIRMPNGRNRIEPFNPKYLKKRVAMRGPTDTPKLPPTRNREMAEAFFSPPMKLTVLNPSGWKPPCPRPLRPEKKNIHAYEVPKPSRAIPTEVIKHPAGRSH